MDLGKCTCYCEDLDVRCVFNITNNDLVTYLPIEYFLVAILVQYDIQYYNICNIFMTCWGINIVTLMSQFSVVEILS